MVNKVLNVILVILVILIIIAGGYLGYTLIRNHKINSDAENFLDNEFDKQVIVQEPEENTTPEPENNTTPENNGSNPSGSYNGGANTVPLTYKGYPVYGKLEIPAISLRYPIINDLGKAQGIEVSVVKIYGPELNEPGNFVVAGHNYNNSLFFGKNKNLQIGQKIYITDLKGRKLEYTIYNKYYTPGNDYSFLNKETNGKTEVTLYTCDATGDRKLVIQARAD